jgi:hypothetical protein
MHADPAAIVGDPAAQAVALGETPYSGPKSDALHQTADANPLGALAVTGIALTGSDLGQHVHARFTFGNSRTSF